MQHAEPSISIRDLSLSYNTVDVLKQLNLDVGKGEFLVLLGSSGCGKSTLLNCIAGLVEPTAGQIFIGGKNVTWEEPSKRGIGMVFQSYALYPQMTVEGNLSFGLRNSGTQKSEIASRIKHASEILQIEALLKRKPAALSGGQRQRVAIGRALVRDVDVFLFDEPLSNLDAKLRADLRVEIKRLHQRLTNTMIYVTHDQIEAMTLADRIAIMRGGLIMQIASPHEIYNHPANKYVAEFIGSPQMNMLEGKLELEGGPRLLAGSGTTYALNNYAFQGTPTEGAVWFGIRPEHVMIGDAAGRLPIQFELGVELVEPMGSDTLVWGTFEGKQFRIRADGQEAIGVGDKLPAGFDPARASMFDKSTEERI
ncbi:sn-glycerol-3-phosphate import ATP-binding protein UgbC [Agrobacterium tumefaciens str. Cherry 2E-2-2]|nr:sn-glycerol-3-phosphate import ATP-binding protein UgbC [Agrobacterium tumefaciens str. Cherry 2E-2-2]